MTSLVRSKIARLSEGATLSYSDFEGLPFSSVAKALSRLAKETSLKRVRKGVYYLPKKTALGMTSPRPEEILAEAPWAEKLFPLKSGAAHSAYNLGITTQVSAETVFIGAPANRKISFGHQNVKTRKRETRHLKKLEAKDFYFLETLRYLKKVPGTRPEESILSLKRLLKTLHLEAVFHAAFKEPPRVRALLGALLSELPGHELDLDALKASLNPLTSYKLGIGKTLKNAKDWNIK